MNSRLLEYRPDLEFLEPPPRDRAHIDLPLAAELLEVENEAELEQFLRDLVARLGASGRDRAAGPALVAALKRAAQIALPMHANGVAGPLINAFGKNGGADLAARAARIFGLELEGLSPEDKEFELAQHFIGFAADAIGRATSAGGAAPAQAAQAALAQAARQYAPGLLQRCAGGGRWRRDGDRIIVFDC